MKLRIAEVAPLWENIPPDMYGGTERVVYNLTEGLVEKGHNVTLFACGTSKTSAKLISVYPRPLFRDNIPWTNISYPLLNITEAFDRQDEFDIIHVHLNKASDFLALPLAQPIKNKVIFTLHFPYPHNRPGYEDRAVVLEKYKDLNYISISNAQRTGGESLNWVATVYNGIDMRHYTFHEKPQNYFAWLGKFNSDKGVKEAIMAAKKADAKLILAGKVDELEKEDYRYFKTEVEPHVDGEQIQFIGEADEKKKDELFGNALAFLNPIQWNEPFGLVMTESMATGTPVISFRNGSAPELITDDETGFLVSKVDEMVIKMKDVEHIHRKKCRQRVIDLFSAQKMVADYEKIFLGLR